MKRAIVSGVILPSQDVVNSLFTYKTTKEKGDEAFFLTTGSLNSNNIQVFKVIMDGIKRCQF